MSAARPLALALLLAAACSGDHTSSSSDGSATTTGTGSASASSTTTSSTDGTGSTDTATTTSGGSTTTDGTATTGTTDGSGSGSTTGALPPLCDKSSECPGQGNCLNKPCDVVMNEPGCGEFRCYPECSDPFTEAAFWICADAAACCGGYPCMGGLCTEEFTTT